MIDRLAVVLESWVGVAGVVALPCPWSGVLPEESLFKSEVLRGVRFAAKLPLAGNAGAVASITKQVGEGDLITRQQSKPLVVPPV